jgi:nucleotide-binding universal stress UspA family protein
MDQLQRVLLCVSGAETPSKAAAFLAELVSEMNSEIMIMVLHIMSQISATLEQANGWQLEATAAQLMDEGTPEGRWLTQEIGVLNQTNARVLPKVRHGLVIDELMTEASNFKCDLLVIGANRQAGWQRILLDDIAHQILVRADFPVLVV